MIDVSNLEKLVLDLSTNSTDPEKNFAVALEYDRLNQTSSAAYFYLRAAEHGYKTHPLIVYTSLLRMGLCFNKQPNRQNTVIGSFLHAVTYMPSRPEAHFLLARYYERTTRWQECYTQASVGLMVATAEYNSPLPAYVEYNGIYCLLFEKAVSGWWLGQKAECKELFDYLLTQDLTPEYKQAVENNLKLF